MHTTRIMTFKLSKGAMNVHATVLVLPRQINSVGVEAPYREDCKIRM
jgi:hypothetical protein